jgi:hypothetical protein
VQPVSLPCEPKQGSQGHLNHSPVGPKQARWGPGARKPATTFLTPERKPTEQTNPPCLEVFRDRGPHISRKLFISKNNLNLHWSGYLNRVLPSDQPRIVRMGTSVPVVDDHCTQELRYLCDVVMNTKTKDDRSVDGCRAASPGVRNIVPTVDCLDLRCDYHFVGHCGSEIHFQTQATVLSSATSSAVAYQLG